VAVILYGEPRLIHDLDFPFTFHIFRFPLSNLFRISDFGFRIFPHVSRFTPHVSLFPANGVNHKACSGIVQTGFSFTRPNL